MAKFKVGDRIQSNERMGKGYFFEIKDIQNGFYYYIALPHSRSLRPYVNAIEQVDNYYDLYVELPKVGTIVRPYAGDEFYREEYYTIEYYFKRLSIDWFILSPKSWAAPFIISYDGLKANFSI